VIGDLLRAQYRSSHCAYRRGARYVDVRNSLRTTPLEGGYDVGVDARAAEAGSPVARAAEEAVTASRNGAAIAGMRCCARLSAVGARAIAIRMRDAHRWSRGTLSPPCGTGKSAVRARLHGRGFRAMIPLPCAISLRWVQRWTAGCAPRILLFGRARPDTSRRDELRL
jgi:hypothetical protein